MVLLSFFFCPTVFQTDGLIENNVIGRRVFVDTEVSYSLELILIAGNGIFGEVGLYESGSNLQRIGVEKFSEILFGFCRGVFYDEQTVLKSNCSFLAVFG